MTLLGDHTPSRYNPGVKNPVAKSDPQLSTRSEDRGATQKYTSLRQGDHIFGNVQNIIRDSLTIAFSHSSGSAATTTSWKDLFRKFSPMAYRAWEVFDQKHYGHYEPYNYTVDSVVGEYDKHSTAFGDSANSVRWMICEIVHKQDGEVYIGGGTRLWVNTVITRYQSMLECVVDETALYRFLERPVPKGKDDHPACSLAAARQIIPSKPNSADIQNLLTVINALEASHMLMRDIVHHLTGQVRVLHFNKSGSISLRDLQGVEV